MAYPTPAQADIRIPPYVKEREFLLGFEWALQGGQITRLEQLRMSYRMGFRAWKLLLNEIRREQGVIPFPMRARMKMCSVG